MGTSMLDVQKDSMSDSDEQECLLTLSVLINSIRDTAAGDVCSYLSGVMASQLIMLQWKVLVVDETSRKLLDNTVNEDDILRNNITRKVLVTSHTMYMSDSSLQISSSSKAGARKILIKTQYTF